MIFQYGTKPVLIRSHWQTGKKSYLLFERDLALFVEVFCAYLLLCWLELGDVRVMTFLYVPKNN